MTIKVKNGSALLLAFLIMTSILVSVLYVSRFSLRQIKQSKSVDNANIAFYAAESGNEQAIYYLRQKNIIPEKLNTDSYFFNGFDSSIIRTVDDDIQSINIGLKKNQFFQFDLYNLEDLGEASNLSYLSISWEDNCSTEESPNSSWIELTVNEWKSGGSIVWSAGGESQHVYKSLLNESSDSITEIGGSSLDPNKIYQFRVKALFCDIHDLKIQAFDGDNNSLKFKNIYVIKTIGQYPGGDIENANRQALSVSLRREDPLSGLFDYVIFSEESLLKDFN
ncbi:MAG TPA: hypothetical protein PLD95_00675 [bacterium]|jgi:hypothetical protein|nr:hypothetical protein [bacterium]HOG37967.1 hypothetical protein [bacterium]HQI03026.1 hypothetical protein [bacterium]